MTDEQRAALRLVLDAAASHNESMEMPFGDDITADTSDAELEAMTEDEPGISEFTRAHEVRDLWRAIRIAYTLVSEA